MIDLLIVALIYAILKVCEGVSINLLSSTVFESIKDKISKKKGKSEKELLKDVIQELKKSGIGGDILKEITKKEDRILSESLEYYSEISTDTEEIKRLSQLLTEKVEAMDEQISEKTAELLDRVSGFDLPRTYRIFERDLDGVRDALYIHPTIIEGYIERPETEGLTTHQNIRILGTPGLGKTTAIYKIIERSNPELIVIITDAFTETEVNRLLREDLDDNFLLVWDDFHVRPTLFMDTIYKLRNKFDNFYVLCAARSTEMAKINDEIPFEFWDKVNLTEVITLKELERDQNIELIRLCCNEFNIEASDEVVLSLAAKNEHSAGTPLYIVSVLIKFRDGKIRGGSIENLPGDVVTLWKDIYFPRLSTDEKTVLYCSKLLKMIYTPPFKGIVSEMWKNIFEKNNADLFGAIESLERKLWLKEKEDTYSSFDVQLEAVEIRNSMFKAFETFVESNELEQNYKSLHLFNMSYFYSERIKKSRTKEELLSNLSKSIRYIEEAIEIYRELGLKADVAMSLNNASNRYSDLAALEETKERRKEQLDKAIEYIEEAIEIYRELGLKADVAMSLNNASNFYSDLAALEETKEGRKEQLDTAIEYVEEAIEIYRELGLKADVAMSLNNASNFYSDLAALEETKEGRKEQLDTAIEYVEEAIEIRRELGLKAEIAMSLNNASNFYSDLAALEETKEGRKEQLDTAIEYVEEAIEIRRELGLKAEIAGSLNNASNRYFGLAALEETKEGRKEQLDTAIEYVEEAIEIRRELGLKAEIAGSLNNASNRYFGLAALEETKEGRKEQLDTAIEYVEEAIEIYRELGLKADVAMSLNNASNFYSDLAALEETKEGRKEQLDTAIEYVEEAIEIRRELGLKAEIAMSLNNASNFYSDLAALEETKEGRKEQLDTAIEYVEEAIEIYKELGLKVELAHSLAISVFVFNEYIALDANYFIKAAINCDEAVKIFLDFGMVYKAKPLIPYGIHFHETLFEIDGDERHKQVIEVYKSTGS